MTPTWSDVKFRSPNGLYRFFDSVKVEEEGVAATAGEDSVVAGLHDVGLGAEEDLAVGDDLRADRFDRPGLGALGDKDVYRLLAVLGLGEHVADRDVRQQIPISVDVEPVDGAGMERVGIGVGIEDDGRPCRVCRRLEDIEIAEVEPLVPERRA